MSDDRLIDEIWRDDRLSNSSNSLRSQVAILRRAIAPDTVLGIGLGYAVEVDPDDDATRFCRLIDRSRELARDGDLRSASQGYHTAIGLVPGSATPR